MEVGRVRNRARAEPPVHLYAATESRPVSGFSDSAVDGYLPHDRRGAHQVLARIPTPEASCKACWHACSSGRKSMNSVSARFPLLVFALAATFASLPVHAAQTPSTQATP